MDEACVKDDNEEALDAKAPRDSTSAPTEKLLRDLIAASHLDNLPYLYRGPAHDLRSPLNALALNLELLRMVAGQLGDAGAVSELRAAIETMSDQVTRLDAELQRLLVQIAPLSDAAGAAHMPLAALLGDLLEGLSAPARSQRATLRFKDDSGSSSVYGVPGRLRHAFLNVLVNALQSVSEGGNIDVRIGTRGRHAEVQLCDDGPGIADDVRDRIYDLHFTTRPPAKGLGLYVARHIIQKHQGTIELLTGTERGAAFRIRLPLTTPDAH